MGSELKWCLSLPKEACWPYSRPPFLLFWHRSNLLHNIRPQMADGWRVFMAATPASNGKPDQHKSLFVAPSLASLGHCQPCTLVANLRITKTVRVGPPSAGLAQMPYAASKSVVLRPMVGIQAHHFVSSTTSGKRRSPLRGLQLRGATGAVSLWSSRA